MSNFVDIKSSVADILGIANSLRIKGQTLSAELTGAMNRVSALESAPGAFPRDEFTEEFLKTYHKSVEVPGGGGQPMSDAVKDSVPKLGDAMDKLGGYVAHAMWGYTGTDDDNRTEIDRAGRTD